MDYNFNVETKEAGQRKPYGDSYYHYIVEDKTERGLQEWDMKQFCTGYLKPAKYSHSEWLQAKKNGGGMDVHFSNYYTEFKKVSDRKYSYKVVSSYTG